jgi:hypothetical protein
VVSAPLQTLKPTNVPTPEEARDLLQEQRCKIARQAGPLRRRLQAIHCAQMFIAAAYDETDNWSTSDEARSRTLDVLSELSDSLISELADLLRQDAELLAQVRATYQTAPQSQEVAQ